MRTGNDYFFSVKMKGDTAMIVAYNKQFSGHRFVWSTGIRDKSINPDKPPKKVSRLLEIAQQAYDSLQTDGRPINNKTLLQRIKLIRDHIAWVDNEVHIWTKGNTVEAYTIPDGIDKTKLTKALADERIKLRPNYRKVMDTYITGGANGLFGFWSAVLDGRIKPRHGKALRKSTVSGKRQTLELVKEFAPDTTFEKMDMMFYNTFTEWMRANDYDANTIGKHVKELKAILHLAYRNELMEHDRFKYWPVTKESNEVVTLTKDDLIKIIDLQLTGTKKDVRDIFVMACFLGPRISDFKAIRPESFTVSNGIEWFQYVQEKTGAVVKIPVHPIIQKILKQRKGQYPRMIAEQNFREYVKLICKDAELNDRVIVKIREGKPEYKKKHEAISPHSARRTFASSLYYGWWGKPMPASLCMRYTGHKTEKSFLVYIGATDKEMEAKALEYFDVKPVMHAS